MDGQRQQVAERREKQRNKAVKPSWYGWKVGTKRKKRVVWCLWGVISAKRSPNGLFVTQQTGTQRADSRGRLLFHLYWSVSLLHFVKKISAHSLKDQLSVLIRRHSRNTAAFRNSLSHHCRRQAFWFTLPQPRCFSSFFASFVFITETRL